ncbi:heavy-metal-associated domain-containing protein [Arthrobacter echini]|uniref:Heavy-metal-associated domain-containing protein n=2 Tax=Arthrobacter echini TaxID=1529066 RepID=A0A5D0XLK4_9MICC|nr:heavy-metal-associated domain-containing protein [Arthrobacter echini]THJ64816.1 heavy-metal-associated domain-containing protein [Arthrobacter echini]TYC97128.1 heavy-metal-associated domain-containing protein [Arthrobacter echini]
MQTTINITGMTCGHCVSSVMEELSDVPGVEEVDVQLNVGGVSTAAVTADVEPEPGALRKAVETAGYTVVGT